MRPADRGTVRGDTAYRVAHVRVRAPDYRIGYTVNALEQDAINLQLGIDAERRESPMFYGLGQGPERGGADQRVIGHATLGW